MLTAVVAHTRDTLSTMWPFHHIAVYANIIHLHKQGLVAWSIRLEDSKSKDPRNFDNRAYFRMLPEPKNIIHIKTNLEHSETK